MEKRDGAVKHFIAEDAARCRLRLRKLCSGFEPTDNREPPVTHVALTVLPAHGIGNALRVGERQPNIVIAARRNPGESLFGYPDNREWDVVQFNRVADYLARAAEGALPVAIVQHGDRCGGRCVVRCVEQPTSGGLETHRAEKVPRNKLAVDDGRKAVPCQVQPTRIGKGRRRRKDICLRYFAKHRFGERAA